MIARPDDAGGPVILVRGAIPGERVVALIDRIARGAVYGRVLEVLDADPARRAVAGDPACGGAVYAHIDYPRQLELKGRIVADALYRIGKLRLDAPVPVMASREVGYRMRARLHVRAGRIGFLREGTHELCGFTTTGQLLPETLEVLERLAAELRSRRLPDVIAVELAENLLPDERVLHLEHRSPPRARALAGLREAVGVSGLTWGSRGRGRSGDGVPHVTDPLEVLAVDADPVWRGLGVRRHVRSFFQGNRHLAGRLVAGVVGRAAGDEVIDLYAGVGLFAAAVAATAGARVIAVERHAWCGADLEANLAPFGGAAEVEHRSVEQFLRSRPGVVGSCMILDPPRVGLSREVLDRLGAQGAARLVYVSCDVATLARDLRGLLDAAYRLDDLEAFDLYPNTAHVEVVATLTRVTSRSRRGSDSG